MFEFLEDVGGCLALPLPFKSKEGGNRDRLEVSGTSSSSCGSVGDGTGSSTVAATFDEEDIEYTIPGRPPPKTLCGGGKSKVDRFGAGNMDSKPDDRAPRSPFIFNFFAAGFSISSSPSLVLFAGFGISTSIFLVAPFFVALGAGTDRPLEDACDFGTTLALARPSLMLLE